MKHACAAALLFALLPAARAQTPPPEILRVTRLADDFNEGSLRFAIEASNRAPGRYQIEIDPVGAPPFVMKPASPLPPIKGPARLEGAAWKKSGAFVVLDGSGYVEQNGPRSCPGAAAGQFGANVRTLNLPGLALVDTADVEISGLEIRNFCIGILIHRSSGNLVRDNRIVGNHGGAGLMLTGDDGAGNSTAATTVRNRILRNEFIDNGDGLELTRGAAFNLVANNVFRSTPANPEPSQGVEILEGHDNVLIGNRFENYSDGVQINRGNRNVVADNVFTGNTLGLSLSGIGNIIERNAIFGNAVGVALRPTATGTTARLSRNAIHDNGGKVQRCFSGGSCDADLRRGGIVSGTPGPEHAAYVGARGIGVVASPESLARICPDGAPACHAAPNAGIAAPVLESARRSGAEVLARGRFDGAPGARLTLELFGNRRAGGAEGELFLADAEIVTDANGRALFAVSFPAAAFAPAALTATATSSEGATSEFSKPVAVAQ